MNETAFCELKKDLPPSSQNLEVARDLAALSVLGGVLIVGIRDAGKNQAGEVVGVEDPGGRMTRLVALADGLVQPSLVCDVWVVDDPRDGTRGCVVCVVPPSASAPHRVDDRYWGRSADGKRVLSDPEVAELFAKRRHRDDDFRGHLERLSGDFDPLAPRDRSHGHLYFSARPLQPNPAAKPTWDHDEHALKLVSRATMPAAGHGWGDLSSLTYRVAHPFGIMATSYDAEDRARNEQHLAKLLVRDDGAVDFVCGVGTVAAESRTPPGDPAGVAVPLPTLINYTDQCVRLVALVAGELAVGGTWRLGVRVDRLLGAVSLSSVGQSRIGRSAKFPESDYVAVTDATGGELAETPAVVERLMRPLARGLGEAYLFPYEQPYELFRR